MQLDVASWCPLVVTVSGDDAESEAAAFARDLLPGVLYVVDRNFVNFAFLSAVLAQGSDVVLSASRGGITTQLYVAVIAVLMMYAQSGRRVSVYALQVLSYVARGEMKIEQALAILARRERERELERARQARRRAKKTA